MKTKLITILAIVLLVSGCRTIRQLEKNEQKTDITQTLNTISAANVHTSELETDKGKLKTVTKTEVVTDFDTTTTVLGNLVVFPVKTIETTTTETIDERNEEKKKETTLVESTKTALKNEDQSTVKELQSTTKTLPFPNIFLSIVILAVITFFAYKYRNFLVRLFRLT